MSAFQGAANTVINGGSFTAISNMFVSRSSPSNSVPMQEERHTDVVFLLLRHSIPSALLHSPERRNASTCKPGTRDELIQHLERFVTAGSDSSPAGLFWIHGIPKCGKSAVAQTLAVSLQAKGQHAASFFFSRHSPERGGNACSLIPTLACQLAINLPAVRPFMATSIHRNPLVFTSSNAAQMRALIIEPINDYIAHTSRSGRLFAWARRKLGGASQQKLPRLILIDALDACDDEGTQAELKDCFAQAARELRFPFRFVITCRPVPCIVDVSLHDDYLEDDMLREPYSLDSFFGSNWSL